ncbi:universal stress protein [Micromonospora sp. NPDC049230]|uniref:universal stress protein n=1 Tax=Micromonospora sp. NPDC049230 TaxID=3155502 RepID=UPI0033C8B635
MAPCWCGTYPSRADRSFNPPPPPGVPVLPGLSALRAPAAVRDPGDTATHRPVEAGDAGRRQEAMDGRAHGAGRGRRRRQHPHHRRQRRRSPRGHPAPRRPAAGLSAPGIATMVGWPRATACRRCAADGPTVARSPGREDSSGSPRHRRARHPAQGQLGGRAARLLRQGSAQAVAFAFLQARARSAELHAIHVWESPTRHGRKPSLMPAIATGPLHTAGEQMLREATVDGESAYPDVTVVRKVLYGDTPVRALCNAADDAAMVVVGARGGGGFDDLLLGSISDGLVRYATRIVAVVRDA